MSIAKLSVARSVSTKKRVGKRVNRRRIEATANGCTLDDRLRLKRSMDDGTTTILDPIDKCNKTLSDILESNDVINVIEASPLLGSGSYGTACMLGNNVNASQNPK